MKKYQKCIILLFVFVVLLCVNVFSQKKSDRYEQYFKYANIDLQNDSLSDYIVSIKKNLQQAKITNDTFAIAENDLSLALIYSRLNSYDIAIDYNLEALSKFEEVNDTLYIVYAMQNLSAMYGYTGCDSISIEYSKKILEIGRLLNNKQFILGSYVNLCASQENLIGVKYYIAAINLAEELNDSSQLAYIYNNIGTYYFREKNLDSAKYFFVKSLSYVKNKKSRPVMAVIYTNIAEVDYNQEHYNDALEGLKKAIKLFDSFEMVTDVGNSYKILIKSLIKSQQIDSLLEYFEKYIEVQEDIVNKKKIEQTTKMQILYEVYKYEAEINVLTTKNELNEAKLMASKLKLYLASSVILLTIIILIVFIIQNSRLKISYKKIVDENVKSLKFENENIRLKKELKIEVENKEIITTELEEQKQDSYLYSLIISVLEKDKLYKNPNFDLVYLSKILDTNRTYISKAINKMSNKTFNELINDYRINEAKKMLCSKDVKNLSIEGIGKESGFKSKSTFFRVFKTTTGVTPNFFSKNADSLF